MSFSDTTSQGRLGSPSQAGCVIDGLDQLAKARDMIELVAMTCRQCPDEDQRALSTGVHFALEMIDAATLNFETSRR
jgi:hypothetical protein